MMIDLDSLTSFSPQKVVPRSACLELRKREATDFDLRLRMCGPTTDRSKQNHAGRGTDTGYYHAPPRAADLASLALPPDTPGDVLVFEDEA